MDFKSEAKNIGIEYNVSFRVVDSRSGKVIQSHKGHNAATNSMLTGIGHYLIGNGILGQGSSMLSNFIPKYISLGTMGLTSQEADEYGLPTGIDFNTYMEQVPGFSADGYGGDNRYSLNNNRPSFGLGPMFSDRADTTTTINCELISSSFPRSQITYRDIIPEYEAELPQTIDIVYSAMISTGALAQFRPDGHDYLFITEAGLWSDKVWDSTDTNGANGLLAGYRIVPPNESNWDMSDETNREILKSEILRVGKNQVVQVIWKLQIGAIKQLTSSSQPIPQDLYWMNVGSN